MKFVTVLICILIQHIVNVTSFENHLNDLGSPMKKDDASFETLRIEKINEYFQSFKDEFSGTDLKKFYKKLFSLVTDCELLIQSSAIVSNKKINNFIDTRLSSIHKKFNVKGDIDEFLKKFQSNCFNLISD